MILGTLSFANLVGAVSRVLRQARAESWKTCNVSRDMFNLIDEDGSGYVDRLEFHRYVLVREGKVKRETLEQIDRLFDYMDRNGNGLLEFNEMHRRFERAHGQ